MYPIRLQMTDTSQELTLTNFDRPDIDFDAKRYELVLDNFYGVVSQTTWGNLIGDDNPEVIKITSRDIEQAISYDPQTTGKCTNVIWSGVMTDENHAGSNETIRPRVNVSAPLMTRRIHLPNNIFRRNKIQIELQRADGSLWVKDAGDTVFKMYIDFILLESF